MRKMRIVSLLLTLIMIFSVLPTASAATPSPTFSDVPTSHWAYQYIERASDKGWVTGVGNGRYDPEGAVSNAQFMTMLARAFYGDYADKIAANVSNDDYWWVPYAQTAWDKELLPGTQVGTEYDAAPYWTEEGCIPSPISRYDMAYMMSNLMANYGTAATEAQKQAAQTKIGDWSKVPDWYKDAVANVYALGIIAGNSDGCFGGDSSMTRAQAAVVMCRLDEAINGDGTAGVQKPGNQDPKPIEPPAGDTTFAMLKGENVQQMMDRINAATPAYREGYLTNGEPISDSNIQSMMSEMEKSMPDGTTWDANEKYDYHSVKLGRGGGCNSFAYAVSDAIFGEDAPLTKHQRFEEIKIGDVIWSKNISGSIGHLVVVTSNPDEDGYFDTCDGNNGGKISWDSYSNVQRLMSNPDFSSTTYVYTRY